MDKRILARRFSALAQAQEGQILALALITMIFGAVVLAGFLSLSNAALQSSAVTGENLQAYYAADAGMEDAIWKVRYGDLSSAGVSGAGSSNYYTLTQPINGFTVTVSVTRIKTDIALDDFESGAATGGAGWLAPWTVSGAVSWATTGSPYRGVKHLRLDRD
ncbi:MAG: hypothetical protein Q8O76_07170, partial [Chloroflexota bacterium]|nr:hypothetical protein [Chloroflexota bacterium]